MNYTWFEKLKLFLCFVGIKILILCIYFMLCITFELIVSMIIFMSYFSIPISHITYQKLVSNKTLSSKFQMAHDEQIIQRKDVSQPFLP